ncbi:MAG: RES family NAD+ phosphorylase [Candidatus Binatus sp.]|uniref:RES family NAD+ phosphorylase n=1 Tax=Candidatus Binatus sp. TaxID=2811406 RepID=UPI002718853C|nr:RES family NAD+ phosphorylase [Candidatus Binatus sp.]MDO8434949.1 RES family NAD+ phosphorylase [Candidatus Binatus sp.]
MPGARKPRDPALLDALDALDRVHYAGEAWRVVRDGRDPLQGNASGGRWDPTLFDVLYTSLDPDGAVAEVHFHLSRQPVFPSRISYRLHRIKVRTAKTLSLPDLDAMVPLGVDPARYRAILYEPTQAIGDAAYFLGFDSIIAPNARWSCDNLIVFTDQLAPAELEVIESTEVNWTKWRKKLN